MQIGISPRLMQFDPYGLTNKSTKFHILLMLEPLKFSTLGFFHMAHHSQQMDPL